MRDSMDRPASLRAGRGLWVRIGLITLTVGTAAGFYATVTLAAEEQSSSSVPSTDVDRLEEIVVTARKRNESLIDIPASITAISAATIEDAHLTQVDDLNALVSNLNIDEAHDNVPDVTLRGIGSFGVVQGVGFYVNDVQLFEGQIARPIDIERIEVLKGPQGTLYGGANVGGAIKYVTKEPTAKWENQATVEFGQYQTKNYQAVFSGPLDDGGKVGLRASFYYDSHGGYIYDTYNKVDLGAAYDRGGRITVVAAPNADNKIHLYLSADDYSTSSQNLLYTPPDDQTYYYSVNDYFLPSFKRHILSAVAQFDHQLNADVALTSLASFFTSYNRGVTDFAKQAIPIDKLQQNADHRVYSEELRLASTGSSSLSWLAGAFFQGHKIEQLSIDNFYNQDPNNPLPTGTGSDRGDKMQRQYALFGDLTYHQGNWQYELGLRAEYYSSTLTAVNDQSVPPDSSGRLSGHEFSPRVSVQYKFSPTLNVYSTIARGFTPGDEIEENGGVHGYRPEIATNYEMGLKAVLDHSVQFNAAVFYIDYSDRLYQNMQIVPLVGLTEVTTNVGKSQNYGVEFDLAAPLPGGFKVSAGMGLTRAVWGDVPFIDPNTLQPINLKGRFAPFAPAYTANSTLEWRHDFKGGYQFGTHATASFIGRSYWDPQNSAEQRAYHLVNLGAGFEHDIWKVSASVTNLTQTTYNTIYWPSYDVGAPFNIARINRPREFVVSGTLRF